MRNMKKTCLAMSIALALGARDVVANPNGAQVVHGSASFSNPSANVLNVHNSHNAVINWQNFNIGAGQTTNFIQPSSASSVLNRVISNQPSAIFGNLNSNGRVFLINQNGLLIGQGAAINTAGFVGSTLNITNEDFLNGRLHFEGGGLGDLENHGYIHAGEDGSIVLIAPNIENGGVIEVEDGNVILAAGKSITITSLQNSAIEFEVSAGENEVRNLGQIIAHKGAASLFAKTLKHSGHVRANGLVRDADGRIRLVATDSNEVSGEVIAEGGHIEVLGDTVEVQAGARIDASSANAGGEILIGGDQQGLNPDVHNATSTTVEQGAQVKADATDVGNGGKVIVFADNDVHVHGEVMAKGGPNGGDGGFVETSGLRQLDITQIPDATASQGKGGEWLIDPNNITINSGTGLNMTAGPNFTTLDDGAILDVALIVAALNGGQNVTVSTGNADADGSSNGLGTQVGNIDVLVDIIKTAGPAASLTLNAHNNISVLPGVTIGSAADILNLTFNPDSDGISGGSLIFNTSSVSGTPTTLNTNGGQINVTGQITSITGDGIFEVVNSSWLNPAGQTVSLNGPTPNGVNFVDLRLTDSQFVNQGDFRFFQDARVFGAGTGASLFQNEGRIDVLNGTSSAGASTAVLDTTTLPFNNLGEIDLSNTTPGINLNAVTFDLTADGTQGTLNLTPNTGLFGEGTFFGDVVMNGGAVVAEDTGFSVSVVMDIVGDLTINSGAIFTVIWNDEVFSFDSITADTITINGGNAMFAWQNSFSLEVTSTANAAAPFSLPGFLNCRTVNCLNGSFATVVHPLGVTPALAGPVINGQNLDYVINTGGVVANPSVKSWVGSAATDWNTASNWSGLAVPVAGDYVFLNNGFDTVILTAVNVLDLAGIQSRGSIRIDAGSSLDVDGDIFLLDDFGTDSSFTINGGTLSGTGVVYNLGPDLNFTAGSLQKDVVNWSVINPSNGLFEMNANIANFGAIVATDTAGLNTWFDDPVTGTGSIDNFGLFAVGAGFALNNIDYTNRPGSDLRVAGPGISFDLNSPTATLDGKIEIAPGNFMSLGGLDYTFAATLVQSGEMILEGGNYSGTFNQTAQGVLDISAGIQDVNFTGFTLNTAGTTSFTSSVNSITFDSFSVWTNSGTFSIETTTNQARILQSLGFAPQFINQGVVNVNTAPGVTPGLFVQFDNRGDINISANSTLLIGNGIDPSINSGTINIANFAVLELDIPGFPGPSVLDLQDGSAISGTGTVRLGPTSILQLSITSPNFAFDPTLRLNMNAGSTVDLSTAVNVTLPNNVLIDGGTFISAFGGSITAPTGSSTQYLATNSVANPALNLDGVDWLNNGTFVFDTVNTSLGDLNLTNGAVFTNAGTMNFNHAVSGADVVNDSLATVSLVNTSSGIINIDSDNNNSLNLFTPFNNQGTVNIAAGDTLFIDNPSTNSGTFNVASGATLRIDNGTSSSLSLQPGSVVSGAGLFVVDSNATLDLNALVAFDPLMTLDLLSDGVNHATINNFQNLTVPNVFNIEGANLVGTGGFSAGAGVTTTFFGIGDLNINVDWLNNGSFNFDSQSGDLNIIDAVFANAGIMNFTNVAGGADVVNNSTAIVSLVNTPTGQMNLNPADNVSFFTPFNNQGAVTVAAGKTLFIENPSTHSGIINLGAGSILQIDTGTSSSLTLQTGAQITGTGSVNVEASAILDVATPFSFDPAITLQMNTGGAISSAQNLTMPNTFNWFGGTISGTSGADFTINNGQTVNLFGSGDMILAGGLRMVSNGTVLFQSSGGNFEIPDGEFVAGGSLQVQAGGNFVLTSDSSVFTLGTGGTFNIGPNFPTFSGAGTLNLADSSILNVNNSLNLSGLQTLSIGASAQLNGVQNLSLPSVINVGVPDQILPVVSGSGTLSIPSATTFNWNSGVLSGADALNPLNVSNLGTFNVASSQSLILTDVNFNNVGTLTGPGNVIISTGSSLSTGGVTDIANISLFDGTLTANNFNYGGNLSWFGGTVNGGGLSTSGTMSVSAGNLNTDWTIESTALVLWSGTVDDELIVGPGVTITNRGQMEFSSLGSISGSGQLATRGLTGSTGSRFVNAAGGRMVIAADSGDPVDDNTVVFDQLEFVDQGGNIGIQSGTFSLNGSALDLNGGGTLHGFGTFAGNVNNSAGTVAPGIDEPSSSFFEIGRLAIDGNYTQSGTGALSIKIGEAGTFDQLAVSQTFNAGGDVFIKLVNGATQTDADNLLSNGFAPFSFTSFSGRFESVQLGANTLQLNPDGSITTPSVVVVPPPSNEEDQAEASIISQLQDLFETEEIEFKEIVLAMRLVDEEGTTQGQQSEDEKKKKRLAPRLVCK